MFPTSFLSTPTTSGHHTHLHASEHLLSLPIAHINAAIMQQDKDFKTGAVTHHENSLSIANRVYVPGLLHSIPCNALLEC